MATETEGPDCRCQGTGMAHWTDAHGDDRWAVCSCVGGQLALEYDRVPYWRRIETVDTKGRL